VAGWLLAWSRDDMPPDTTRWARSTAAALRYGGAMSERRDGRIALAAWRRDAGEFAHSGTLADVGDAPLAWIGQCVEDNGDATEAAISCVAAPIFDESAAGRLNGPFAAAMARVKPFEVRVVTDRHRHYPVYVHRARAVTVACTEMRCVIPWLESAQLDLDAVDMLLRCGELIDGRTLLQGIEVLAPGTILRDSRSGHTELRYWTMRSDGADMPLASSAADLAQALKRSVRRLEAVSPRLGITLSGGLDSRIILDLCERPDRVPSFTWGLPGCRDIVRASEFAALVHSPHVVRHWEPEAFVPLWSRGVDLTGGSCGIEGMFMLPFVPLLSSSCDVLFNGLAGDVILGGNWLKHSWLEESDIAQLGRAVWRWRVPEGHDALVDRLLGRQPGPSSPREQWIASISKREGARPIERLNDWLVENRIFRTTNCGTMLLRGGVESHAPFFDRDFIDILSRARQGHKFKHRLYLDVMNRVAPRSASVPWQRTNVKPAMGYYANLGAMAYQNIVRRLSGPLGIKPFRDLPVADPAGWFRGPWRASFEQLIFGGRFSQRGLVRYEVARQMWEEHLAGVDHTRQLSVLVAIELFARQAIDGERM
jgi:asparagine synthase (glutamine-hydrolysing)